jgi:hypothetical protein
MRRRDPYYYQAAQHGLITELLSNKACAIKATLPDDCDQIFGYMVHGPGRIIHWVFTKYYFRNNQVARRLVQSVFDDYDIEEIKCSFKTPTARDIANKYPLKFNSKYLLEAIRG